MIKSIKNLVYYDLKYIFSKRNIILLYLIISIIVIVNMSYGVPTLISNNVDLYGYIFMNSNLTMYVPVIISVYLSSLIFFDNDLDSFLKIRIVNKQHWLLSKVLTICIINLSIITIITLLILLIGGIFLGVHTNWSNSTISFANNIPMTATDFKYTIFYSPIKLMLINSSIYILFMTFISLICNIISLALKTPKLSIILPIIYIIISFFFNMVPNTKLTKFLNPQSYIILGTRNYYNFGSLGEMYLTFKQAFFIPLISLTILIFISVIIIRKFDFCIGEKHLWS